MADERHFQAVIQQIGAQCRVYLPFDPNAVWGSRARHDVTGSVNGAPYRGPVKLAEGRAFISLGEVFRQSAGLAPGDSVAVVLALEGPQAGNMPDDLNAALAGAPQARAFFEALPTFYRKNYLRWVEGARRPETRGKRIQEMLDLLAAGKREK